MAISALKKVSPVWYTPDSEKDSDAPARFRLQPLLPSQREQCMSYTSEAGFHIPPKQYQAVLGYGVVDWENISDEDGQKLRCSPGNLDRLPGTLRMELAMELLMMSQLTEADAKN